MAAPIPVSRQQFIVKYLIDNYDLKGLGIYVKNSTGLFDAAKRKIAYRHDWIDEDGEVVDLATFKKENREFNLDCFVVGETITDAIDKINSLLAIIDTPGVHTLTVDYYGTLWKREYAVYREEAIKVVKQFRYRKNIWTFNLALKEYIS